MPQILQIPSTPNLQAPSTPILQTPVAPILQIHEGPTYRHPTGLSHLVTTRLSLTGDPLYQVYPHKECLVPLALQIENHPTTLIFRSWASDLFPCFSCDQESWPFMRSSRKSLRSYLFNKMFCSYPYKAILNEKLKLKSSHPFLSLLFLTMSILMFSLGSLNL